MRDTIEDVIFDKATTILIGDESIIVRFPSELSDVDSGYVVFPNCHPKDISKAVEYANYETRRRKNEPKKHYLFDPKTETRVLDEPF